MGEEVRADKEVTVEYRVSYDTVTKGIGDGDAINKVWYAVYLKNSNEGFDLVSVYKPVDISAGEAVCPVVIANDQTYKVVFVAQHYDGTDPTYTIDAVGGFIRMPNYALANSENYDLFHAVSDIIEYNGQQPAPVVLDRVVAQVNLYCSQDNWNAATAAGKVPTHSDMTLSGVPEYFYLISGNVSGSKTIVYNKSSVPGSRRLAYAYCLADGSADVTVRLYKDQNDADPLVITSAGAPMEKNKKTNINGAIIY